MIWKLSLSYWTTTETLASSWMSAPASVLKRFGRDTGSRDMSQEIKASNGTVTAYCTIYFLDGAFEATKTVQNAPVTYARGHRFMWNDEEKFKNILSPFKTEWLKKFQDAKRKGEDISALNALCRKKANEYVLSHIPAGWTVSSLSRKIRVSDMEAWLNSPKSR